MNPSDQLKRSLPIVSTTARDAFVACHFILSAGSAVAIFYVAIGSAPEAMHRYLVFAAAYLASMVWYKAIENPLRRLLLFGMAYVLTSKQDRVTMAPQLKKAGRSSAWTSAILLTVTLVLSQSINIDVGRTITSQQDSTTELQQADKARDSYDADVQALREQVEQARRDDKEALAAARRNGAAIIAAAKPNRKMSALAKKGNGWAISQIAKAKARAETKARSLEDAARANAAAPGLQSQLATYMTTRSVVRDSVGTMAMGLLSARNTEYISTANRRTLILFIATFFVLVVYIASARLLVLACLQTGEDLDTHYGDGIGKVVTRKAKGLSAWLGRKVDNSRFMSQLSPAVATTAITANYKAVRQTRQPDEPIVRQHTTMTPTVQPTIQISLTPDEIRKCKDRCRAYYKRQFTSQTYNACSDNKTKFEAEADKLKAVGYTITTGPEKEKRSTKRNGKVEVVTFDRLVIG